MAHAAWPAKLARSKPIGADVVAGATRALAAPTWRRYDTISLARSSPADGAYTLEGYLMFRCSILKLDPVVCVKDVGGYFLTKNVLNAIYLYNIQKL